MYSGTDYIFPVLVGQPKQFKEDMRFGNLM
jgi:hypothetical protein